MNKKNQNLNNMTNRMGDKIMPKNIMMSFWIFRSSLSSKDKMKNGVWEKQKR